MWLLANLRSVHSLPIQVIAAGSVVTFGLNFLNPATDLFGSMPQTYRLFAVIAPEWAWGCGYVAAGSSWLIGMAIGCRMLANIGAVLTMFCRLSLIVLLGMTVGFATPAMIDHTWWLILCIVADWRRRSGTSP